MASVLEEDGRFLCIEELVEGKLKLNQPAGRLEVGETPAFGAVRETLEESGYSFSPTHLVGVYEYFHVTTGTIFLRLAYTGTVHALQGTRTRPTDALQGTRTRPTDALIRAVHWLTYEELEQTRNRHRSPFVMQCVTDYRAGKFYPLDLVTHFPPSPVM